MKKILTSNSLKLIAIFAMTLDHIAWVLFPGYPTEPLPIILHMIGRITCPIMCYFVAEGYHHTRDVNKYTIRLFAFAFISHFAYVFYKVGFSDPLAFIPFARGGVLDQTSVIWSLAFGLVMLRVVNSKRIKGDLLKTLLVLLICLISLPADWSCIAALCILVFGTNRGNLRVQMLWMLIYVGIYSVVYCLTIDLIYGILQMSVALSIPLIMMYNGERGANKKINSLMKWLFYIYYPLHLVILGVIRQIV